MKRNSLLRKRVWERDQGICATCGRFDAKAEVDHIVALWSGGKDELANLQTLCRHCHMRKSTGETPLRAKSDRLAARHQLTQRRRRILGKEAASLLEQHESRKHAGAASVTQDAGASANQFRGTRA